MGVRASVVLLLAFVAAPAAAQQLGTLFHSPQEREALERIRRGLPAQGAAAEVKRPPTVMTGYVQRSDGRSTVFIDRKPYRIGDRRLQERLDPRLVDRYDPYPWSPPAAVADGNTTTAAALSPPATPDGAKAAVPGKAGAGG